MKLITRKLLFVLICTMALYSCGKKEQTSRNNATILINLRGIENGTASISYKINGQENRDTIKIENGKASFHTHVNEPIFTMMTVLGGKYYPAKFYTENGTIRINGHVDSLKKATVTGGEYNQHAIAYKNALDSTYYAYDLDNVYRVVYGGKVGEKQKSEAQEKLSEYHRWQKSYINNFVENHRKSYYSLALIEEYFRRFKSPDEIEIMLLKLDESIRMSNIYVDLIQKIDAIRTSSISQDKFFVNEKSLSFKKDDSFKGSRYVNVKFLTKTSDDKICALMKDSTICIIAKNGDLISQFKFKGEGKPGAVALDENDNIYISTGLHDLIYKKNKGRKIPYPVNYRCECSVYSQNGKLMKKVKLPGLKRVSATKIADDMLFVSDCGGFQVAGYDLKTFERRVHITKVRPCCGILHFDISKNKEIVVGNLGAFKIQVYDYEGNLIKGFGQRGKEIKDFHGCCNPVSLSQLSTNQIVTAEKNPTRIKIYGKDRVDMIQGLGELVKGCTYVPMITDSKDNIYLASPMKGIIKCISVNM